MILRFHPLVLRDVWQILFSYDTRSNLAGERFFAELEDAAKAIKDDPQRFHLIDSFRHRFNLRKYPYHLIYEVHGDGV